VGAPPGRPVRTSYVSDRHGSLRQLSVPFRTQPATGVRRRRRRRFAIPAARLIAAPVPVHAAPAPDALVKRGRRVLDDGRQ